MRRLTIRDFIARLLVPYRARRRRDEQSAGPSSKGAGREQASTTVDRTRAETERHRLLGVVELVALSRATLSNIWQNIAVALGFKAVFLVTTVLGVTSLWMAILADTGATVLVTANALRLLRFGHRS